MTLKRSLKIIANDTIVFPIYDFLLVVSSNYGHKWLPFRDIRHQRAVDLDLEMNIVVI